MQTIVNVNTDTKWSQNGYTGENSSSNSVYVSQWKNQETHT